MCSLLAGRLHYAGYSAKAMGSQDNTKYCLNNFTDFTKGFVDIIVTQDLGTRGVNIPGLQMVIHYDMPKKDSVHNLLSSCGRVGRLGNQGNSFIFIDFSVNVIEIPPVIKVSLFNSIIVFSYYL